MTPEKFPSGKKAVAITYDPTKNIAPKVIAKGQGFLAQNIIDKGKEFAVPIYQNQGLTNMLMAVELDKEIPPELYQAVAQVLVYIFKLDQNKKDNIQRRK